MKVQNTVTSNIVKSPAQLELIIVKLKQEVRRLKQKLRLLGDIDEESIDFQEEATDTRSFAQDMVTDSSRIGPASVFEDQSGSSSSKYSHSRSSRSSAAATQEQMQVPETSSNDILGQYMAQAADKGEITGIQVIRTKSKERKEKDKDKE